LIAPSGHRASPKNQVYAMLSDARTNMTGSKPFTLF